MCRKASAPRRWHASAPGHRQAATFVGAARTLVGCAFRRSASLFLPEANPFGGDWQSSGAQERRENDFVVRHRTKCGGGGPCEAWWSIYGGSQAYLGGAMLPEAIFVDEGIGQDGELSGDGDEGDFCWFSACPNPFVKDFHIGIGAGGAQRSKIEDASHR